MWQEYFKGYHENDSLIRMCINWTKLDNRAYIFITIGCHKRANFHLSKAAIWYNLTSRCLGFLFMRGAILWQYHTRNYSS